MTGQEMPARDPRGQLASKVAFIVGAGSVAPGWGIGRAIAALFAREGAAVFAIDRSAEAVAGTAALIRATGGTCETHQADATDAAQMRRAAEACRARFGRIDILQNNVGGGGPGGLRDTTPEAWRASLAFNLDSAFYAAQAVLPAMLEQGGGSMVHVASVAGRRYLGHPSLAYSVAKAGLLHFSRMVAMEHAGAGIRSNSIVTGVIDTPEIRRRTLARFGEARAGAVMRLRAAAVPNGRPGTVWEVAEAALFLASDRSAYMTGSEVTVDGGICARSIDSYLKQAEALPPD